MNLPAELLNVNVAVLLAIVQETISVSRGARLGIFKPITTTTIQMVTETISMIGVGAFIGWPNCVNRTKIVHRMVHD